MRGRMSKSWTNEDAEKLKLLRLSMTVEEIAKLFGKTTQAVTMKLYHLDHGQQPQRKEDHQYGWFNRDYR